MQTKNVFKYLAVNALKTQSVRNVVVFTVTISHILTRKEIFIAVRTDCHLNKQKPRNNSDQAYIIKNLKKALYRAQKQDSFAQRKQQTLKCTTESRRFTQTSYVFTGPH